MGQPSIEQPQRVRVLQIVSLALMQGILIFGAIVIWMNLENKPADKPVMVWIGLVIAVMAVVVRTIVGSFLRTGSRNAIDRTVWDELSPQKQDAQLIGSMQAGQIIEFAILEGAAFVNLVFYLLEKQTISLFVVGGLLGLMAVAFPTGAKVDQWVDSQKQLINLGS
jgi:hypothetical protein